MTETADFPKLCAAARGLVSGTDRDLDDADIVRLVCGDCPFYKEGEDEELECGAFRILALLLRKRVVTVRALAEAVQPARGASAPAKRKG